MTAILESLFATRGGSLMCHTCESCNEPLAEDSLSPICAECIDEQMMEDE